jgi:hypothetical protein
LEEIVRRTVALAAGIRPEDVTQRQRELAALPFNMGGINL